MKKLICFTLLFTSVILNAQNENGLWKKNNSSKEIINNGKSNFPQQNIFNLDIESLNTILKNSPKRDKASKSSNTIITLPTIDGKMEKFEVYENSVLAPELAAKFPEIKSYIAVGVDNPSVRAYLSSSPLGFKSMIVYPNKETVFIEPISNDRLNYSVYKTTDRKKAFSKFDCNEDHEVIDFTNQTSTNTTLLRGADDSKLRKYRLAISCTGDYATYFGGTKALALAAINNTITRVNGIFERDFGVRFELVANTDSILYTNTSTDPYSTKPYIPNELQNNLNTTIGDANYDLGHLFDNVIGGGNSGGIGCIGVSNYKGKAYSSTITVPEGDYYDVTIVAHELAHQLGANHTFTYATESGNNAQVEPGSGSTIMSYAGKTGKDIQSYYDTYFHAMSIQQVTDKIKTLTCGTVITTSNAAPVVNAGLDYTIPKGTPFMLTGSATDANTSDQLTYSWEQMDYGNATTTTPISTNTTGPLFRTFNPVTSPVRYFPTMNSILSGSTFTQGSVIASEMLPTVARTLNFRLTVRDNKIGGGANNTDDVIVSVNGVAGPFTVDTQNTTTSYAAGTSQTINWTVAGTNANGVNCANVDILLSTDGGLTFPIVLVAGTPNDGTQAVVIPSTSGTTNRIMVKGTNHIFFDVNNANFTITGSATADTSAPTTSTLTASGTTTSSTNLTWTAATDNTGVTGYKVYQNGVLKTTTTATSLVVTGLAASTTYNFYVTAYDAAGNNSSASNTTNVTTLTPADASAPTTSTLTSSGTTTSSTNLTWSVATDNTSVTGYKVYQNGVLKTTTTATSLVVTGLAASTTYNFYVTAYDAAGNNSSASNTTNVTTLTPADASAPTTSTLTSSGTTTSSTNLTWSVATDNTSVTGYKVYQNGVLKTTTTATSLVVTGLAASTTYTFYVTAHDAAGNNSSASNTVNVTTLTPADTSAPTASTLTASGTTTSSTNLTWSVATDNTGVTGYRVYQNGVLKMTTTATSFVVTGLAASTTYGFYVIAYDAAGNNSSASNTANVTTLGNSVTYCTSVGGTIREFINRVQMGTINNLSGNNNGYGNFVSMSTSVSTGSTASIAITPAWNGASTNEAYCVWIDYNQDGNFGSNELVYSKAKSKAASVSGSFIIPTTALLGNTRMRVSMKYNGFPTACETFANGEVEDYTINITNGAIVKTSTQDELVKEDVKEEVAELSFNVYPNPVKDGTIYFSGIERNSSFKIYNQMGQVITFGSIENDSINVSSLTTGIYFVQISNGTSVGTKRFIKE
ncbi:MAG: M12 family metallo-peptidase [Bacteroidota bacterium]